MIGRVLAHVRGAIQPIALALLIIIHMSYLLYDIKSVLLYRKLNNGLKNISI